MRPLRRIAPLGARIALLPLLLIATAAGAQPGALAQVRVERVLSLGGDEGAREAVLVDVADVATGPAGELYVLDAGDRAVKVYSPAGRFVRRFGRQGGGPGEFQVPTRCAWTRGCASRTWASSG